MTGQLLELAQQTLKLQECVAMQQRLLNDLCADVMKLNEKVFDIPSESEQHGDVMYPAEETKR